VQKFVSSNIGTTRSQILKLSCPKNSVTKVLPSCFYCRPRCTIFAIILDTLKQTWWILLSIISTTFHTTLVFSARWNFDHNNPNLFIETNITKVLIQALHDAKFVNQLAHYLQAK
jgi:hypothetical protein